MQGCTAVQANLLNEKVHNGRGKRLSHGNACQTSEMAAEMKYQHVYENSTGGVLWQAVLLECGYVTYVDFIRRQTV